MGAKRLKSKFETEVHLGLMVIVFLLLLLNLLSNFVIFKGRSAHRQEALLNMQQAALAISRSYQASYPERPDRGDLQPMLDRHKLIGLDLVPTRPKDNSGDARLNWFASVIRIFPPSQYPDLADKLFKADLGDVTRGDENEYYYLYPIPAGSGNDLLILTTKRPLLAYLEDSQQLLMVVQIGSLLFVALVYLLLSRFIFRPFRLIRQKAEMAGRPMGASGDDSSEIVREYEQLINQLEQNKAELLEHNRAISTRAHSLEEFNRFLLTSSQLGVVTLDREEKVATVSQTAADLLGVNKDEVESQSYEVLLHSLPALMTELHASIGQDEALRYGEYECKTATQEHHTLGISGTQLRDKDGPNIGSVLFVHDVSELNQLRTRLEDHKRLAALGEMAAGLAHQIRNSLGAIGGFGTLIKRRLQRANMESEPAEQLLDEARQAECLVKRFLSFARPLDITLEPTNLSGLVKETIRQAKSKNAESGVQFHVEGDKIVAEVDPIMLKQAIGNIIDNAILAYGDFPGTVVVKIAARDGEATIGIQDFASGISIKDREKIFTPFFSSRPDGTGLGLPWAAKIVDLHAGSLTVSSEPGKGATFVITLPDMKPAAHSGSATSLTVAP